MPTLLPLNQPPAVSASPCPPATLTHYGLCPQPPHSVHGRPYSSHATSHKAFLHLLAKNSPSLCLLQVVTSTSDSLSLILSRPHNTGPLCHLDLTRPVPILLGPHTACLSFYLDLTIPVPCATWTSHGLSLFYLDLTWLSTSLLDFTQLSPVLPGNHMGCPCFSWTSHGLSLCY